MNSNAYNFTYHANQRASQRGFTSIEIEIILDFADTIDEGYLMSDKSIDKACRTLKKEHRCKELQCLDHLRNVALIEESGKIITIYRADKRRIRRLKQGYIKASPTKRNQLDDSNRSVNTVNYDVLH